MATQNRRLYESLNWADEAPQQDEEAPKEPAKPAWGGAKKQESAAPAPVDFKKLQEQEAASKPKENPKPAPQAEPDRYRPPVRSSEGYQNDRYQSRGDGGYQPRYQQGGDGGYQPRTEEYRQREQERNRGEDYRQREREEIPIPDHPPYTARIGNLAWEVTEESLDEYFGELGIVKISLPRDEQQGKIRGFAFIEFNTREGLENALSCNGQGVTIMNREIHVSVSKQRNNDNRSWGPGEGRERDHDRHWGRDRESDRSWGPGEGRERNYGGDRPSDRSWGRSGDRPLERGPTGPPNLGLKPRSDPATLKREPSPPRKKAGSEDPFGAVSVDEEKNKIALEKRLQREKEMEQRAKERLEEAKAKSEQAEKERQARIEEERRKREEERTKMVAEKRKREEEAANKQKPRDTKDNKSWGRSTEYDKSWGPGPGAKKDVYVAPRGTRPPGGNKPPAGRKSDEQAEKPTESAQPTETAQPDETETKQETPSENPYRGGIGRGQAPNKQNQGEGAGRGKKPPKGGAGRGGQGNQGPKKEAPEKDSDGFTVAKDVVKTKQPNVTYKAALGGAPATQEKKASQNPFGVLQND